MSKLIDVRDLPAKLDELLASANSGEEIIVTQGETRRARLVPIPQTDVVTKQRTPGKGIGEMTMSPDFDEPLPDSFWLGEDK